MVRTTSGALMLALAATFIITGCGEKIPADLTKNWDEKEAAVMTQLSDVKTKFGDLMAKFQALPKDTTKAAEMAGIESQLKENETQIGDVEKTLNDLKAEKDSLVKAGKAADLQAAWEKAQVTYNEVSAKLTGIMASLGPIGDKIQALGTTAATTAPADTAATGSSATAHAEGTAGKGGDAKKGSETKAHASTSKKTAEVKSGESEKSVTFEMNTNPGEEKKPIKIKVEPNKNPK